MKKTYILLIFLLFITFSASAQWGNYESAIGGKGALSLPLGDFGKNSAGTGFGLEVDYSLNINENFYWVAEVGYLNWAEKSDYYFKIKESSIFINTGIKFNFLPDQPGPYIILLVGANNMMYDFNYNYNFGGEFYRFGNSDSEIYFDIAPGIGYEVEIGENLFLDSKVEFINIFINNESAQVLNLCVGVNFALY
jgi:hypothetical protein